MKELKEAKEGITADDFDRLFYIKGSTYDNLMNGENVKLKATADRIHDSTGIDKDILYGEKLFALKEIGESELKAYFESRDKVIQTKRAKESKVRIMKAQANSARDEENKEKITKSINKAQTECEKIVKDETAKQEEIKKTLKNKVKNEIKKNGDIQLFRLFYYIKEGKKYISGNNVGANEAILDKVRELISKVKIRDIEAIGDIDKYIEELTAHMELVKAVNIYKKHK